jgi:diacylglycerol kinase (ATP)
MINFKKLLKSFTYAFEGITYALNSDQNLIIHFIVAMIVIAAGMILKVTPNEMAILGITILFVIATEMINTALEKMVDLITKEHRMEAKIAKDVSSGMVLISAIGAVLIGLLIFIPHLIG